MAPQIHLATNGRYVLMRVRSTDLAQLEKHLFQRYPHREWGTFFRFGFRRTTWGLSTSVVDALPPMPGDLDRRSPATIFKHQYSLRAFRTAAEQDLAIGVIHSHPMGFETTPSSLDDDMDGYFADELKRYGAGRPYLSLIFQRNDAQGLTVSGRAFDRGEWLPVRTMFSIGATIERFHSQKLVAEWPHEFIDAVDSPTARLEELLGSWSSNRLKAASIGIVGLSGTGSPCAQVLARARVGEFVLVDPQRAATSNLERMHGLYPDHFDAKVPPYKVDAVEQLIHRINPRARVTSYVGNVLHDNVLDDLLTCDMVMDCSDSVHGRVFLSDVAKHYLLPSIDVGIQMDGTMGTLTTQVIGFSRYSPELPCVFCYGLVDTRAMSEELMSNAERAARAKSAAEAVTRGDNPDHYWRGQRQQATIGYATTVGGALAAGYAEGLLTGGFNMPHDAFQMDLGKERLGVIPCLPSGTPCTCSQHVGWADQARSFRNVARPAHWAVRALLRSRPS